MNRRVLGLAFLAAVALATRGLCFAAGPPALLKSELKKPDAIWVGQRLDLGVTLYATGAFTGVPRFDLPKDAGLAMIVDDSHPLLGSETIDGTSYLSKRYAISLFPLRAGTAVIPAFQTEFAYQGENGQETDVSLSTAADRITVLAVPGADPNLPLVTALALRVDDRWDPNPDKAAAGDAFTRTIVTTATGIPGMALPPLTIQPIEGLSLYSKQPQVGTDTQRGDFIGKRTETYSIVCQAAGTYVLPEMRIQWWNPAKQSLGEVKLRSVTLHVAPNPSLGAGAAAGGREGGAFSPWLWGVAALLVAGTAVGFVAPRRDKRKRAGPGHEETERALLRRFKQAAEANDAGNVMRALLRWLEASGLAGACDGVSGFVRQVGDPELARQCAGLEASLYAKHKEPWSGKTLYEKVAEGRKALLRRRRVHPKRPHELGPLNPR